MPRRSLVNALSLCLCGLHLQACAKFSPSPVLYKPQVDASLLQPCVDPMLAPDNASDNELAAERLRVAKAYIDCRDRHAALIERTK